MAHVAPVYPSFARGEVSPLMLGRIDIEQYPTCLEKCRNAYVRPYGCVSRLTGTEYIASTKNNGKARLLKFVFSPTDSYIIECGAGYFRFYQNGAPVTSGGNIYEVANDYYEDQLDSIQYVQIDDIIKLTCLPHNGTNSTAKPKELIRNGSANWTFRNVTFVETPYLDANISNITMKPSNESGNITITASSNYFTSSMVGANMWIGTKVKDATTNKDVQGFVKITGYTSATEVSATVQSKLSVNNVATKLWGEGAFSDRRGYPAVVALYDGRLYYARTPSQPRNVYGSKPYAYETFTPAVDNEDDAGINIQLATNANGDGSDIKWMVGGSYLLCGTYGGEFVIRGTGDGAITPTDISARQRTNWGGEPVQPIVAGSFVHFIQRNGNKLRQFQYDFYYDAYKAVDVSIFSEHLLASPIKAMALQKNPDSIIYLLRKDGDVVMLTLEQDQSVQAWSLLEDMGAKVESIQTIPSYDGNYDEVYMVMQRNQLSTTLEAVSSNPDVLVTVQSVPQKPTIGEEVVIITYNEAYGIWTNPDSNKKFTKLTVSSSDVSMNVETTYNNTKETLGVETETLKYVEREMEYGFNLGSNNWSDLKLTPIGYIGVGTDGNFVTSTNGIKWEVKPALQGDVRHWKSLAIASNNEFFAINDVGWLVKGSMDHNNITSILSPKENTHLGSSNNWNGIAYGYSNVDQRNILVAIGSRGYVSKTTTDPNTWASSTDMTFYWENAKLDSNLRSANGRWIGIEYDKLSGYFVAITEEGEISTSADGWNWNMSGTLGRNVEVTSITYSDKSDPVFGEQGIIICASVLSNQKKKKFIRIRIIINGEIIIMSQEEKLLSSTDKIEGFIVNDIETVYLYQYGLLVNDATRCWQSETTGKIVSPVNSNYAINYWGDYDTYSYPEINDTIDCVWSTIEGKVNPLEDCGIVIGGEQPEDDDTITLTYETTYGEGYTRFIERMLNPITPDNPNDWWYVRSGLKYDGYALTKGKTLTLSANSGSSVTATASGSIFTSSMVGNRIRLIDKDYNVLGEGEITAYTSGTVVTLNITTYFQSLSIAGGSWGISTDALSGLDHLEGREVQIYADGIEQEKKAVSSGSITIDDAFLAVVGLSYTSYITTMPMEAGSQNGTAVGKRKRISEMAIRVWNSLGVRVGRDLDNLYETIYEQQEPFTGVIPNIKYNQGWVWDANITVEQSKPYPMNILSIAPIVTEVDK